MIICGREVEFNEELHEYRVDGKVVPNVSTILGTTIFKEKYNGVENVEKAVEQELALKLSSGLLLE